MQRAGARRRRHGPLHLHARAHVRAQSRRRPARLRVGRARRRPVRRGVRHRRWHPDVHPQRRWTIQERRRQLFRESDAAVVARVERRAYKSGMKLYFSNGSCSLASHIALEESGAKFETQRLSLRDGEQNKPEFLKINPKHKVPTVVLDDGTVLTENPAIISYVAATHPEPNLLAQPGHLA